MKHAETIALHGAYRYDSTTKAVTVPIYQTAAYAFDDTQQAADIFSLREDGNTYTRLMNPTSDIFEQRMAMIEGGSGAICTASGQAAITFAIMNLCQAGDNFISSTDLYGGTWNLFANTLRRTGIEVRFVSPRKPENFAAATDDRTRCYFGESLPNPKLIPFPIQEVANIGARYGIPLLIDNTMVPLVCRPFDHGATVVIYSTTKFIGGHGSSIGGMIIDSGRFDWNAHPQRIPLMTEPDAAHDNVVWPEAIKTLDSSLGSSAYILKIRMTLMRDIGACLSPFNAFLMLQGLETLPLRMRSHCENACAVAHMLQQHPQVEKVTYPSLITNADKALVQRYLHNGLGPLLQFEIKGGFASGSRFIEALQLAYHAANIGDARTLAIHPASTTHAQLPPADKLAAGVTEATIRLSIGIEHIEDICADIQQALAKTQAR